MPPGVFRGREQLRAAPCYRVMPLLPGEPGVEVRGVLMCAEVGVSRTIPACCCDCPFWLSCYHHPSTGPHMLSRCKFQHFAKTPMSITLNSWTTRQVLPDLPPLGTALPVVVPQPRGQPRRPLPAVGDWVKLKVVGQQLHEVRGGNQGRGRLRDRGGSAGGDDSMQSAYTWHMRSSPTDSQRSNTPCCKFAFPLTSHTRAGPAVARDRQLQPHHSCRGRRAL
jgi:hypothetical protein